MKNEGSRSIELFDTWNVHKKAIELAQRIVPHAKRRSVWWADIGINIGHEHDGNHVRFERPVLIVKTFGNDTCLILPLTKSVRADRFRFDLAPFGYRSCVVLDQLRLISAKRLTRWIEDMDTETFKLVHEAAKRINGFS